ncbi:hypothetical protein H107_09155 [Trichophyton rubrum CBS 202.88]|nr:hypothetical protein H107_09155 [Trichophyton rubrum CBS 202.88]
MEPAVPRQWPCPIAKARNPPELCLDPENVYKPSSRNRVVKCRNCRDDKKSDPGRDNDTGASGPASGLTIQSQGATVGA